MGVAQGCSRLGAGVCLLCLGFSTLAPGGERVPGAVAVAPQIPTGATTGCQPKWVRPAVQSPGALILRTAALAVGMGVARPRPAAVPRRPRPAGRHRRARALESRGWREAMSVGRVGTHQRQARVRESVPARSGRPNRVQRGRAPESSAARLQLPRPARVRSGAGPRPEARGARQRRLVSESRELASMDGDRISASSVAPSPAPLVAGNFTSMDRDRISASSATPSPTPQVAGNFTSMDGDLISASSAAPSPTSLVAGNFTSMAQNLAGRYRLAESVRLHSTEGLPLGNRTHPFTGSLSGDGYRLTAKLAADGNLALFGGVHNASLALWLHFSRLVSSHGNVTVCAGRTEHSRLDLIVQHSHLQTKKGVHAALVEELGDGNSLAVAMADSRFDAAGRGSVVAGPVAHTRGSGNRLLFHHFSANEARAQSLAPGALASASLGWGFMDRSAANNTLEQLYFDGNRVLARVEVPAPDHPIFGLAIQTAGRAHASLAGVCRGGAQRLEQWEINNNQVEAQLAGNGGLADVGVAALGLVHDAQAQDPNGEFEIRQRHCRHNTVRVENSQPDPASLVVAALALATDASRCGHRCQIRCGCPCVRKGLPGSQCDFFRLELPRWCQCWANQRCGTHCQKECPMGRLLVGQNAVVYNNLSVPDANTTAVSDCSLVGSVAGDYYECPRPVRLFLFSGGESQLPLFVPGDGFVELSRSDGSITCTWNGYLRCPTASDGCSSDSLVDGAAYGFSPISVNVKEDVNCPWPGVEVNSTGPADWRRVNAAFCITEPEAFDGERLCHWMSLCHNPGEAFHSLVSAQDRWLLVTRQTWPWTDAGLSRDLFRVATLSAPQASGSWPLLERRRGHEGSVLYAGARAVPGGLQPVQALVSAAGVLVQLYQYEEAGVGRLLWTGFPAAGSGEDTAFTVNSAGPLPAGALALLVSEEEPGASVWTWRDGEVTAWPLEQVREDGFIEGAYWRRFALSGPGDPVALARHGDWLYSLHAGAQGGLGVQRLHVASGSPDPDWNASLDLDGLDLPLRLAVEDCRLLVMPTGSLAHRDGSQALRPLVPTEGGCLEWGALSLFRLCLGCVSCLDAGESGNSPASSVASGAVAGGILAALAPVGGAAAVGVALCLCKRHCGPGARAPAVAEEMAMAAAAERYSAAPVPPPRRKMRLFPPAGALEEDSHCEYSGVYVLPDGSEQREQSPGQAELTGGKSEQSSSPARLISASD